MIIPRLKRLIKACIYNMLDCSLNKLSLLRKKFLPHDAKIRRRELLAERFDDDCQRFMASSAIDCEGCYRAELQGQLTAEQLLAILNIEYHRIEKGLALPSRRALAGQDVVLRLESAINEYRQRFGNHDIVNISIAALECYQNENSGGALSDETKSALTRIGSLAGKTNQAAKGGFKTLTREEIIEAGAVDKSFFTKRHSIRDYLNQPVPRETILNIIDMARYTPSVCNRQGWRLHVVETPRLIADCLALQNGNRGFTEKVKLLLAVSADLHAFVSVEERNQGWIDGGLFSMALMYAIHANGLGSCPLNWCATKENDLKLRQVLELPPNESVIMLITVGYIPDHIKVAISSRKSAEDICLFH